MNREIEQFLFDLESELEETRIRACRVLAQIGDESAITELREATRDEAPSVRYFAGKALNSIKDRLEKSGSAAPAGVDHRADTEPGAEKDAGPVDQEGAPAGPAVQELPESPPHDPLIRHVFDDDVVVNTLVEQLETEENSFILSSLIKSVGLLGDQTVISSLLPFLRHRNPRVRANTVESLSFHQSEEIHSELIPMLDDPDHRVKTSAVVALQACRRVDVMDTVARMLNSDKVWMRDSAAYALGEIRTDQAADMLFGLIEWEPKYSICLKAVRSLGRIGSRTILPRAIKLRSSLRDPRKKNIAEYLIKRLLGQEADIKDYFDEDPSFEVLENESRDTEAERLPAYERMAAGIYNEGLQAIENQQFLVAKDRFMRIVDDYAESEWASIAMQMVATIAERETVTAGSTSEEGAAAVQKVPEEPGGEDEPDVVRLVESLIRDLANPDEDIRRNVVLKLMQIDDPRAIKPLTKAAMDKDSVVRYFAKRALRTFSVESTDED